MARRNTTHIAGHSKLREELERIKQDAKEEGYDIDLKQASLLMAEKSKRGKMRWDEAWPLLAREGLL